MKHIYLVRHGETDANKIHIHQGSEESLNAKGQKQARHVALLLKNKNIDTLITSPFVRARETAQIIGEELELPFSTNESLVEFRRPNNLYGKGYYSFSSLLYMLQFFLHQENLRWNNDGAENMFTARNRIVDAQNMLIKSEGENIVVVSHAIFMDMFVELACKEKKLNLAQFIHGLLLSKRTPNTGIIHLYYDERIPKGMCAWQLIEFINPKL